MRGGWLAVSDSQSAYPMQLKDILPPLFICVKQPVLRGTIKSVQYTLESKYKNGIIATIPAAS